MGLFSRSLKACNKSLLKESREDNQVNSLLWVFERRIFFCQKFSFSLIASLVAQLVKDLPAMQENRVQPEFGRSPGEGKGDPLQYSGLENAMDCIGHVVTKSWAPLRDSHLTFSLSSQVQSIH